MNNYLHKIEFEYDIEKHVKIIARINKKNRVLGFILLASSIIYLISVILKYEMLTPSSFMLGIFLLMTSYVLLVSSSKKQFRKRLLSVYGNTPTTFIYEFYDDYIKIEKVGGEVESDGRMSYSNVVNVFVVEDNIGYARTKDQSILLLCADNTKEVVDFIKTKLINPSNKMNDQRGIKYNKELFIKNVNYLVSYNYEPEITITLNNLKTFFVVVYKEYIEFTNEAGEVKKLNKIEDIFYFINFDHISKIDGDIDYKYPVEIQSKVYDGNLWINDDSTKSSEIKKYNKSH